jgi:hypothetical protein
LWEISGKARGKGNDTVGSVSDICGRSVGKLGGKEMILIQCGEDERTIHTHIRAIKSHPSNTV